MEQQQRIAIDMDGVIADHLNKQLRLYNRDYGDQLSFEDLQGKKLREIAKCGHEVQNYYRDTTFFGDLTVMEGSQSVIQQLQQKYEVFITTAAMEFPSSFQAKFAWLSEHFAFIPADNIVFCGNKGIIRADYLIDDNSYHFKNFQGKGILFSSPHNVFETEYTRVNNWLEVAALFLA
jgi:5'(3')-deoxyribonucleotidase